MRRGKSLTVRASSPPQEFFAGFRWMRISWEEGSKQQAETRPSHVCLKHFRDPMSRALRALGSVAPLAKRLFTVVPLRKPPKSCLWLGILLAAGLPRDEVKCALDQKAVFS